MKRLLMLGGSMQQILAIKRARELGNYVIRVDEVWLGNVTEKT